MQYYHHVLLFHNSTCKDQTEQIENIIHCQGGQNVRTQECQSGFAPEAFLNAWTMESIKDQHPSQLIGSNTKFIDWKVASNHYIRVLEAASSIQKNYFCLYDKGQILILVVGGPKTYLRDYGEATRKISKTTELQNRTTRASHLFIY